MGNLTNIKRDAKEYAKVTGNVAFVYRDGEEVSWINADEFVPHGKDGRRKVIEYAAYPEYGVK